MLVLGPFLVIVGLLIAGWGVSVGFVASPIVAMLGGVIFPNTFELYDLFASLVLCGLGFFIGIGMYYATKATFSISIRYLKYNINLVKGGLN